MAMQSSNLLPTLQELPGGESSEQHRSFREIIIDIVSMDRTMYAAEFATTASAGLWGILSQINVDDKLFAAFEARYTIISEDQSLYEYAQQKIEDGPEAWKDFIEDFKGKVAEFDAKDLLESNGYSNVEIHPNPNNEGWDISAIGPDGQEVLIQVKTGAEGYAYEVMQDMAGNDYFYYVSTEIYDKIAESSRELVDRLTDIGGTKELEGFTSEGLELLTDNMGINVPDGIVNVVPYAPIIIGGLRLIVGAIKTENEFKAADRTTKNKIQVVQTLTLMSRVGIPAVFAAGGGAGGAAIGSPIPFAGNLIGGIAGALVGAGIGKYASTKIEPHMLKLGLNITSLTNDDLFYYKNKPRIDAAALNFQTTARELEPAHA